MHKSTACVPPTPAALQLHPLQTRRHTTTILARSHSCTHTSRRRTALGEISSQPSRASLHTQSHSTAHAMPLNVLHMERPSRRRIYHMPTARTHLCFRIVRHDAPLFARNPHGRSVVCPPPPSSPLEPLGQAAGACTRRVLSRRRSMRRLREVRPRGPTAASS